MVLEPDKGESRAALALVDRWRRGGLPLRAGAAERDLDAFEARYGVRLPGELRSFLGLVDGQDDMDHVSYVRFWPLNEIKTVAEDLNRPASPAGFAEGWFAFADYLYWSHGYVIRLGSDGNGDGSVGYYPGEFSDDDDFPLIASSSGEFLNLLLADSPRLRDPFDGAG